MWSVQMVSRPAQAVASEGTGRGEVVRVKMSLEASSSARAVGECPSLRMVSLAEPLLRIFSSLCSMALEVRSTSEAEGSCKGERGDIVPGAIFGLWKRRTGEAASRVKVVLRAVMMLTKISLLPCGMNVDLLLKNTEPRDRIRKYERNGKSLSVLAQYFISDRGREGEKKKKKKKRIEIVWLTPSQDRAGDSLANGSSMLLVQ